MQYEDTSKTKQNKKKEEEEIIEQFQKLIVKIQCYFYVYFLCVMYKISDLSYNAFYAIWDRKNGAVFMYSNIYVYIRFHSRYNKVFNIHTRSNCAYLNNNIFNLLIFSNFFSTTVHYKATQRRQSISRKLLHER